MNPPSREQQIAIDYARRSNIVINSVAGSGKTTTILHIAKNTKGNTLILTYNRRLMNETSSRIKKENLNDKAEVYTYHSFMSRFCGKGSCKSDREIMEKIDKGEKIDYKKEVEIIIADEVQDMTRVYFDIIRLFFKSLTYSNVPQICVLGDSRQTIYEWTGANSNFILQAPRIFDEFNNYPWESVKLTTSYRITQQIAGIINIMDNTIGIKAVKDGPKVEYISTPRYRIDPIADKIIYFLDNGYNQEDIFVLSPSMKFNRVLNPVVILANTLKKRRRDINIYIPDRENKTLTEQSMRNKIVFSTFHQAKGLERNVVIVLSFSMDYFTYFKKLEKPKEVPWFCNELYVAVTRSKEHLVLVNNSRSSEHLPFFDIDKCIKLGYINYTGGTTTNKCNRNKKTIPRPVGVTRMLEFIPCEVVVNIFKKIKLKYTHMGGEVLRIKSSVRNNNRCITEDVADLNGTAIVAYYEYIKTGRLSIHERSIIGADKSGNNIENCFGYGDDNGKKDLESIRSLCNKHFPELQRINVGKDDIDISTMLKLAICFWTFIHKLTHRITQIPHYKWINDSEIKECMRRMDRVLGNTPKGDFEVLVFLNSKDKMGICGFADYYDPATKTVWEFKCVYSIADEYILQVLIYSHILAETYRKKGYDPADYIQHIKIFNILTDEICEIECSFDNLKIIYNMIYNSRFSPTASTEDPEEFIREIKGYKPFGNDSDQILTEAENRTNCNDDSDEDKEQSGDECDNSGKLYTTSPNIF